MLNGSQVEGHFSWHFWEQVYKKYESMSTVFKITRIWIEIIKEWDDSVK